MPDLTIRQLDRSDLDQAWPLVNCTSRIPSLLGWRRFAGHLFERGGGVVGIAAPDGHFHGIATYEPIAEKRSGRLLQVDILVAFELSRRAPVRRALCEALDGFARLFDCEAVRVSMPSRGHLTHKLRSIAVAPDG